jgi:hypothetical protein
LVDSTVAVTFAVSRILIPSAAKWYDELKAVSYYGEADLERHILQHVKSLFPDDHVFPFKQTITSKSAVRGKKPDLAFIRKDFSAWGLIEVELSEHDLAHVFDQTEVFLDGEYNSGELAEYVKKQMKTHCRKLVPEKRLTALFRAYRPLVFVIADEHAAEWQSELSRRGVGFCVLEIYKTTTGGHIYRTVGQYPRAVVQHADCRRHESMANMLEIIGNFEFTKAAKEGEIEISFEMSLTRWKVIDDKGKRYLRFLGKMNPLSPNETYGLFKDKSNRYYFRRS